VLGVFGLVVDNKLMLDVISVVDITSVLVSDTTVLSVLVENTDDNSIGVVLSLLSVLESAVDDEISTELDILSLLVIVSV
jgi:hypothetical protein